jgi:anti-sigma factor RsiW
MKPTLPHDPFDDLIAAALHDELTSEERTQFETRLQTDPAARAAYQEVRLMHDLLEKTYREVQPDPAFEQRMVSGVRRKLQHEKQHCETAWESILVLWAVGRGFLSRRRMSEYAVVGAIVAILAGVALGPITRGLKMSKQNQSARVQEDRNGERAFAQADKATSKFFAANELAKDGLRAPFVSPTLADAVESPALALTPMSVRAPTTPVPAISPPTNTAKLGTVEAPSLISALKKPSFAANLNQALAFDKKAEANFKLNDPQNKVQDDTLRANQPASLAAKPSTDTTTTDPSRKLIRNAELELEVKSFQTAMDQIALLTKSAGGYVDTGNSQRGGNGKLQGTVVVKILPQNLDDFLLKLRDLGELKNQTLKTDDVTKAYYDTQARLENSRRMETQLQELLKHDNSKVADLLQVERELGRVRGEIEQMQGELKLYDFQVQYATVTMQVSEKDLNQAAAYLLKEQDNFSLFATDVEATFQQARHAAEDVKAQILQANLNHNSGSNISADLDVMVAPDQIDTFLAQIKALGRIANFERQTQRVAKDGGDSDQPADQALTEKDKVQVHLSIQSDDESRKQVALTVVTTTVDDALEKAKAAALAGIGVEILGSSLNKTLQGQSTAQLSVRVPGKNYPALLDAFRALGRAAAFSLQRDDNAGPGANGDDAPVIVSLSLTDDETPLQQTEMSVLASNVDAKARQIKKDAAMAGVEIKASSYQREPNGMEIAQMTFRLPMSKYPAFVESLKNLGKVELLTVHREDRPDQTRTDESAPAEIGLRLHNQGDVIADDNGLWATLRQTFGEGAGALLGSVRMIGVVVAFLAPWIFVFILAAWGGRRIYVWRKNR